ncbi:MAG TPA: fatty acid--CoA ligase family protein [Opitutaceae bacterium]|nr:fatty acid--CoA ligase family protein [Opitutaceae bacterium]
MVEEHGADAFWIDDDRVRTWRDFGNVFEERREQCAIAGVGAGQIVAILADDGFDLLTWLFAAASLQATVAPLRIERRSELETWAKFTVIDWQVQDGALVKAGFGQTTATSVGLLAELLRRGHPGLILATGGTTGVPKVVLLDLWELLGVVQIKRGRSMRLMPLMRFDHIGGLDIAWRAIARGQSIVAPPALLTPASVAEKVERHRVEVLPATPSFLNLLLLAGADLLQGLRSLRVVPYGAEPMPPSLLARLRESLPEVRFTQRFGTSETGALPVRESGEGFTMQDEADRHEWKIVEGELWIRSPARAVGYLSGGSGGLTEDGWFRTGDLAERTHDPAAVRIVGRRDELINVGGEKVLPATVENLLLAHPLVADCRAFAVPNPLLGQVVGVEIVWRGPEKDPIEVKRSLHEFARSSPKCYLPTTVRLVRAIDSTRNLKKRRSALS